MLGSGHRMLERGRNDSGFHPASCDRQPATGQQEARTIVVDVHKLRAMKQPITCLNLPPGKGDIQYPESSNQHRAASINRAWPSKLVGLRRQLR